jgi:hypothetical protein
VVSADHDFARSRVGRERGNPRAPSAPLEACFAPLDEGLKTFLEVLGGDTAFSMVGMARNIDLQSAPLNLRSTGS